MKASAGLDESSSDDQDSLFEKLRALTEGTECAILIADHFNKSGVGGNQASVRGSSAKVDASRITMTLSRMTVDEHEKLKPPRNREVYVHLEDPKQNYARAGSSRWFEIKEYPVGNGEDRPALVPWSAQQDIDLLSREGFRAKAAVQALVNAGRPAGSGQAGWPWCSTFNGQKSARLDSALSERLGCTLKDAQEWIETFEVEELIAKEKWRSPSNNVSEVWVR